jgi:hypothetical protein
MIDRDVVRDLEQPTRKLELGSIPVDVVQDLDESVLRKIFRDLAVANHTENEGENRPFVPAEKLAERRLPPLLSELDDVGIREIR